MGKGSAEKASLAAALGDLGLGSDLGDLGSVTWVDPSGIPEHPRLQSIFPISDDVLALIVERMIRDGYDESQPILIWNNAPEGSFLLDGHTRKRAAMKAGLSRVAIYYVQLNSWEQAEEYVFDLQLRRRNLTDAQRLRYVLRRTEGPQAVAPLATEPSELSAPGSPLVSNLLPAEGVQGAVVAGETKEPGRPPKRPLKVSTVQKALGVSAGTASKILAVADAPADIQQKVLSGEVSVNKAFSELKTVVEPGVDTPAGSQSSEPRLEFDKLKLTADGSEALVITKWLVAQKEPFAVAKFKEALLDVCERFLAGGFDA